jgi:hypothetical protein
VEVSLSSLLFVYRRPPNTRRAVFICLLALKIHVRTDCSCLCEVR